MNDELGRLWKELVLTYFKILSPYLPAYAEEYHEKLQSG
jgi:hypothetical protein